MRNIIAGNENFDITIGKIPYKFTLIKYYVPESFTEKLLMDNTGFKNTLALSKGIYIAQLPDKSKLFAVKFTPGKNMFPFIYAIDNTIYTDGFLICGLDVKAKSFFKIVL